MAKPYKLEIVSDVSQLVRSMRQTGDAIDDVVDHLDSVADGSTDIEKKMHDAFDGSARSAKDAGRDVERAMKDASNESEKAAEKTDDSFSAAFDRLKQRSKTFGDQHKKDMDRTSEVSNEAANEVAQNWSSTMSSFDGSAESVVQMVADSFGGLAGSLDVVGPIGSLFLGATGGLLSVILSKWMENNDRIEESNRAMYEQMLENANAYFSNEQIVENFNKIMSGADDAAVSLKDLQKLQEISGLSQQEAAYAYADPRSDTARALIAQLDQKQAEITKQMASAAGTGPQANARIAALSNEAKNIAQVTSQWKEYSNQVESNSEQILTNNEFLQSHGILLDNAGQAQRDLINAQADANEAYTTASETIAENIDQYGGLAAAKEQNQAALSDLVDALRDEQNALADSGGAVEAVTALQYEQAAAFIDTAKQAGITEDAAVDLAASLGLIPEAVATNIRQSGADGAREKAESLRRAINNLPGSKNIALNVTPPNMNTVRSMIAQVERGLPKIKIGATVSAPRMSIQ